MGIKAFNECIIKTEKVYTALEFHCQAKPLISEVSYPVVTPPASYLDYNTVINQGIKWLALLL